MSHPPEDKRPLPEGWIRQFDSNNNAWFYVDTRANPPRSIWVHPLDDPEYQRTHKDKDVAPAYSGYSAPAGPPPSASQSHPELGQHDKANKHAEKPQEKRGAFGKLKDKLVGSKEEREAHRQAELARREEERLRREQLLRERQQRIMQMQAAPAGYYQQAPGGYYQQAYPQQGGYYAQQQPQQQGRSGFGGGGMGMGLPILGGLAGGLLLGSALDAGDGGFGGDDGGGFGGDDGGGDFGGGGDF
ncbi:hypothetical protein AURDEDRAFT_178889 [Auricularia subglabra TFB-10046 SS5]|nr:hypothetical protein AURDEDRAFT_178889 [Auricularia subglabra TFB-10046 SS5]